MSSTRSCSHGLQGPAEPLLAEVRHGVVHDDLPVVEDDDAPVEGHQHVHYAGEMVRRVEVCTVYKRS